MSLLWLDGFEGTTLAEIVSNYDTGSTASVSSITARSGSYCARLYNSQYLKKTIIDSTTLIIGMAQYGLYEIRTSLLGIYYNNTCQLSIYSNSTLSTFSIYRGLGSTLLGSISHSLAMPNWVYLELKTTIDQTSGSIELRINGSTVLTMSGINTMEASTNIVNNVRLLSGTSGYGSNNQVDDYYICNNIGSYCNDFLGPIKISRHLPNADGASSQWMGSDGNQSSNYLLVDDPSLDGDSTYVMAASSGLEDYYNITNITGTAATVVGARQTIIARYDGSGPTQLQFGIRQGSNTSLSDTINLTDGYTRYHSIHEVDPSTGLPFTPANINSLQIGQVSI